MKFLTLLLLLMPLPPQPAPPRADGLEVTINPDSVVQLSNEERRARSLPALTVSEQLTRAARAKAEDMMRRQYFRHALWESFIRRSGYRYCLAGENLGLAHTTSAEVVQAWMDSPSHRENLLKGTYREIGVAVVRGRYKGIEEVTITVQMFGTRCN
jgi:uncharacterized protein YkwD